MAEVGKDLWVHRVQLMLHEGHPKQGAEAHVQAVFYMDGVTSGVGHLVSALAFEQ